jgi:hypothetical protein
MIIHDHHRRPHQQIVARDQHPDIRATPRSRHVQPMPDDISDKNDIPVRAAPLRFRLPTAHRSAATRTDAAGLRRLSAALPSWLDPASGWPACINMHHRRVEERAHLPPTGSSWIAVVLASPSVVPAARPVALGGEAGCGSRRMGERNPGRDVGRVHEDPGRFVAGGRTPALDLRRGSGLGTSRWSSPVRSQSPGVGGCDCPARPHS